MPCDLTRRARRPSSASSLRPRIDARLIHVRAPVVRRDWEVARGRDRDAAAVGGVCAGEFPSISVAKNFVNAGLTRGPWGFRLCSVETFRTTSGSRLSSAGGGALPAEAPVRPFLVVDRSPVFNDDSTNGFCQGEPTSTTLRPQPPSRHQSRTAFAVITGRRPSAQTQDDASTICSALVSS